MRAGKTSLTRAREAAGSAGSKDHPKEKHSLLPIFASDERNPFCLRKLLKLVEVSAPDSLRTLLYTDDEYIISNHKPPHVQKDSAWLDALSIGDVRNEKTQWVARYSNDTWGKKWTLD